MTPERSLRSASGQSSNDATDHGGGPSPNASPDASAGSPPLRLALLTTGLRPVPLAFASLPGAPVGIIEWDRLHERSSLTALRARPRVASALARLRGRRYDSLRHLCAVHGMQFAALDKRDGDALGATLARWRIDLVITSGCALVPVDALACCRAGAINLHPSQLPRWRGANPMFWQVANGDATLGATVHRLAAAVDRGHVLEQDTVARPGGATAAEIERLLEHDLGVSLLRRAIESLQAQPWRVGASQPADSPTPYAVRVAPAQIGERLPLAGLPVERAWDIARYLGRWPSAWLEPTPAPSRPVDRFVDQLVARAVWRPVARQRMPHGMAGIVHDDAWWQHRRGHRLLIGRGAEAIECRPSLR